MCLRTRDVRELISFTFPDVARHYMDVDFLRSRAILTPLNENVDEINSKVVEQFPGDACTFYSADSVVERDGSDVYPIEFLNSLQPSGCPPHRLVLKVGMIVMLLRSIAYNFQLQRVQFPIRAAFAMTINKAQGQTMETIGLYLPRPVFSHGQLYVALSRVRNVGSVRVLIIDIDGRFTDVAGVARCTQNIVYSEAL
ncbi:hypothetical protein O6H91_04G138200 [Diphasiastrum complanatum]|uniref:Uncharacterized protein n=1 Tax=Diphasiastrum complanatum TaxID=34168 RepID=A0ACC2E295_DIPCM|nr:hypothetical protein O6H91_04G138200 [Diphasiastrum complanatum]